jgi:hypothetical protein
MRVYRLISTVSSLCYGDYDIDDIDDIKMNQLISNGYYWQTGGWYHWNVISGSAPSWKVRAMIMDIDFNFTKGIVINSYKNSIISDLRDNKINYILDESL